MGPKGPPKGIIPWLRLSNEAAQGATTDNSENNEHLEDGKCLALLVQKEHVHDVPTA